MYVAREQNVTLIKVARVGVVEGSLFTGGVSADPAARKGVTLRGGPVFKRSQHNPRLLMERAVRVPRGRPKRRRWIWPARSS